MCDVTFTFTEFNSSKSERYADSLSLWFLFSLLFSLSSFSYIPDVFVVLFSWKMDKSREVDEFRKSLQSLRSQWATAVAKWPTSPHTAKSPSLVRPLSFLQFFSFLSLLEMKFFFVFFLMTLILHFRFCVETKLICKLATSLTFKMANQGQRLSLILREHYFHHNILRHPRQTTLVFTS